MKKKTVLIVDDVYFMRNLLKKELKEAGYEVVGEARNGKEGIKLYFDLYPDLVTMDIKMPDISGIEVTKQILSKDKNAKILAISGSSDSETKAEILKAGALDFLQKPFQPAFLWKKLDKIFDTDHGDVINKTESINLSSFNGDIVIKSDSAEDDLFEEFELPSEPDPEKNKIINIENQEDIIEFPESFNIEEDNSYQLVSPKEENLLEIDIDNYTSSQSKGQIPKFSEIKKYIPTKNNIKDIDEFVNVKSSDSNMKQEFNYEDNISNIKDAKTSSARERIDIRPPRGRYIQNALYEQEDNEELIEPMLNYEEEENINKNDKSSLLNKIKNLFNKS